MDKRQQSPSPGGSLPASTPPDLADVAPCLPAMGLPSPACPVQTLWIAGYVTGNVDGKLLEWSLMGVFTSREAAAYECVDDRCFIAPVPLNRAITTVGGLRGMEWPARG